MVEKSMALLWRATRLEPDLALVLTGDEVEGAMQDGTKIIGSAPRVKIAGGVARQQDAVARTAWRAWSSDKLWRRNA